MSICARGTMLAGLALLAVTPAFAEPDSASVTLSAEVPQVCTFTTKPIDKSIDPKSGVYDVGELGYTCNYQGNASLTLVLPQGTNFTNPAAGATPTPYGLRWLIPSNNDSTGYQSFSGNVPFSWPTAQQPGTELKGMLQIKLDQDLKVAGTWSTTIGYTITP